MNRSLVDPLQRPGSGKYRRILLLGLGLGLAVIALGAVFGLPITREELDYTRRILWPSALAFNGFSPRELWSSTVRAALLGAATLLLAKSLSHESERVHRVIDGVTAALTPGRVAITAGLLVVLIAGGVLRGVPIVDDEATYAMQADLLAHGRLGDPALAPELQWHREPFTIFTTKVTTGKYLFGAPLLMVPGVWLGFPALTHALLAAFTVLLLGWQLRASSGASRFAHLGAALLAVSPAFAFTAATLQSQIGSLCALGVFAWAATVRTDRAALLGGLALGLCLATRPQLALPCGVALLWVHRRAGLRFWLRVAAGAVPFVALILAYDVAITGRPFTLPGAFYSDERLGFGLIESVGGGYEHTPLKALAIALSVLWRFNGWSLGWPLSLAGPILWLVLGRPHAKAVTPWAAVAAATFLFQAAYFFIGVVETGPAYHFAVLPFWAASTAAALDLALQRRRTLLATFAAVSTLVGTTTFFVEEGRRLSAVARAIEEPTQVAPEAELVFLERSLIGTNPAGTVRGVPFRMRHRTEQDFFPRPTVDRSGQIPAADAIRQRYPPESCAYVYFERTAGRFVATDCDSMEQFGAAFDRAEPPWF